MNEKVTISLNREDWREIAKFLSKKCGEAVNIVPIINLFDRNGEKRIYYRGNERESSLVICQEVIYRNF